MEFVFFAIMALLAGKLGGAIFRSWQRSRDQRRHAQRAARRLDDLGQDGQRIEKVLRQVEAPVIPVPEWKSDKRIQELRLPRGAEDVWDWLGGEASDFLSIQVLVGAVRAACAAGADALYRFENREEIRVQGVAIATAQAQLNASYSELRRDVLAAAPQVLGPVLLRLETEQAQHSWWSRFWRTQRFEGTVVRLAWTRGLLVAAESVADGHEPSTTELAFIPRSRGSLALTEVASPAALGY